jgi:class 3 adenylate cyclase
MKEILFNELLKEAKMSVLSKADQRILFSLESLWETYLEARENRAKAASRLQQLQAENKRLAERERELLERNRIKELELLEETNRNQTLTIEKDRAVKHRLILILVSVLLLAGLAIYSWRKVKMKNIQLRESREIIRMERDRSDQLLLNILPESTADELKVNGFATSKFYQEVSILFTDFSGFTKLAEGLKAEELVEQLNEYFKEFDKIVDALGLEKIKTIGDSYMCAGGLPNPYDDHGVKIVEAAFKMREITQKINQRKEENGLSPWPLRIGAHSGPVVAGVIGTKKFAYDIWGDSVNVAARMEQTSTPGKVNVSASTKAHLNGSYTFEERGEIEAKNKGKIKMFFVEKKA